MQSRTIAIRANDLRLPRSAIPGPSAERGRGLNVRPAFGPPRSSLPAAGDDLLAGVELDRVVAVGVEVAVHRVLPAREREPGYRGWDADVDAEHAGLGAVAVGAGGLAG